MKLNRREVLRYLGYTGNTPTEEVSLAIDRMEKELLSVATPRTVALELGTSELLWSGDTISKATKGCEKVILFAATLGTGVDRLMTRVESINMGDAVILQALAATAIEEVCDELQGKYNSRPRISPGYGDFPLSAQKEILKILDAPRKIGLSSTESLMLVPTKSVTAIFGLKED